MRTLAGALPSAFALLLGNPLNITLWFLSEVLNLQEL